MKLTNFYIRFLQKFVKVREKTIHVEAIVRDDLWKNLKNLIGKGFVWFFVTPANYDYCKAYFNLRMSKEDFSKVLAERINFLKEKNEEIQLHIHLSVVEKFMDMQLQDEKFSEAMKFMNSLDIKPEKMAPGWCKYNDYTLTLSKNYGIKYIYIFDKDPRKKPIIRNGLIIISMHKIWHDYDFA